MIQDFPYGVPFESSGKFVSGTVNWLAWKDWFKSCVIVSLDLEKESYQEIMQPDYGVEIEIVRTLVVLRDCLSILHLTDT
ncbi:F-box family protein, partial [Trifolium medium]|nr:F-box family protein [Trifolium medium]